MKPIEWLTGDVADEIIFHEAGHFVMGMLLGIEEAGIQFFRAGSCDSARSHYTAEANDQPRRIQRSLAGMYSQALTCPSSIDDELRSLILKGALFEREEDLKGTAVIQRRLKEHGFLGDTIIAMDLAAEISPKPEDILRVLRRCHSYVCDAFEPTRVAHIVRGVHQDIRLWLEEDDDWLAFDVRMLFYSIPRATKTFRKLV
ncbi:MAG: hypothetical protein ABMA13_00750 [Chthoniobacteraceae bacterium]